MEEPIDKLIQKLKLKPKALHFLIYVAIIIVLTIEVFVFKPIVLFYENNPIVSIVVTGLLLFVVSLFYASRIAVIKLVGMGIGLFMAITYILFVIRIALNPE